MKKLVLIPLIVVLMVSAAYAKPPGGIDKSNGDGGGGGGVEAHLWLSIPGCINITENPDPWLQDSCVTFDTSFNLTVTNNDPNEDSYNTFLLISLNNDPSLITVKINGTTVAGYVNGSPSYQGFGSHGVWPTWFAEYPLPNGFLPMNGGSETVNVNITPSSGEDMVHFDAGGRDIHGNVILKNPFSHDATYMPEFTTIGAALALIGSGLYARFKRKRKL